MHFIGGWLMPLTSEVQNCSHPRRHKGFKDSHLLHVKTDQEVYKDTTTTSPTSLQQEREGSICFRFAVQILGIFVGEFEAGHIPLPPAHLSSKSCPRWSEFITLFTVITSNSSPVFYMLKMRLKFKKHVLCHSAKHKGYFMGPVSTSSTLFPDSV